MPCKLRLAAAAQQVDRSILNSQSLTSKTNSNSAYVGFQFHCSPTPDVARVKFVKSAQRLGFSLEEVAGLLRLDDGAHCDEARVLAEQKLGDVRGKLADLRRIESVLEQLVHDCCASHGTVSCPLIVSLHGDNSGVNRGFPVA